VLNTIASIGSLVFIIVVIIIIVLFYW